MVIKNESHSVVLVRERLFLSKIAFGYVAVPRTSTRGKRLSTFGINKKKKNNGTSKVSTDCG